MSDPIVKAAKELIKAGDLLLDQHYEASKMAAKIVGEDHEYYKAYTRLKKAVTESDKQKT